MKFKAGISTLLFLFIAACAKSPESIAPSYISDVGYQSWQCKQLAEEDQRLAGALATASTQQKNARTNDTVGVLLIGLPVSSMSGDNRGGSGNMNRVDKWTFRATAA